jgi:hypothetical protein
VALDPVVVAKVMADHRRVGQGDGLVGITRQRDDPRFDDLRRRAAAGAAAMRARVERAGW